MADTVVLGLIAMCIGGMLYSVFSWHHWQYKRYAEWCWEWRDRSAMYRESAQRLLQEFDRLKTEQGEVQFLQILYNMDIVSAERTAERANHWERELPRWCRGWYLKRYR